MHQASSAALRYIIDYALIGFRIGSSEAGEGYNAFFIGKKAVIEGVYDKITFLGPIPYSILWAYLGTKNTEGD